MTRGEIYQASEFLSFSVIVNIFWLKAQQISDIHPNNFGKHGEQDRHKGINLPLHIVGFGTANPSR